MLAYLVQPISGLMHRLSFQKKFILAGGLMVVALLVALAPGVLRMKRDLDELQRRQAGIDAIAQSLATLAATSAHRELHLLSLRGLADNADALKASASALETRITGLRTVVIADPEVAAIATEMNAAWGTLRERSGGRYNAVKANADYAVLLSAQRRHLDAMAAATGMLRESAPAARRQATQLAVDLPELSLALSEAGALGVTVAAGLANDEDRQRLAYLSQHLLHMADSGRFSAKGNEALSGAVSGLGNLLLNRGVLHPENGIPVAELTAATRAAAEGATGVATLTANGLRADLAARHADMLALFAAQLAAIGIILAVATYVFVGFWHASRETIDALVAATERIIAGDLNSEARVRSRDELSKIAGRFNELASTLREVIGHIAEHSHRVTAMAGDLSRSANRVIGNTEEQARATLATSASVQQIAVGIASVNDNASDLERQAREGVAHVTAGEAALKLLQVRMGDMRHVIGRITDVSNEFLADSRSVAGMTRQVKEISDQTNLLALNAAIEAARAGEAGRGFAVVADAVRALAEKVADTAREIDAVMAAMMSRAGEMSTAIADGGENLARAEEGAGELAEVLLATGLAMRETHSSLTGINLAISEQKLASEDISRHVDGIAGMADSTQDTVGDIAGLIREMVELTRVMGGHVARFQT